MIAKPGEPHSLQFTSVTINIDVAHVTEGYFFVKISLAGMFRVKIILEMSIALGVLLQLSTSYILVS